MTDLTLAHLVPFACGKRNPSNEPVLGNTEATTPRIASQSDLELLTIIDMLCGIFHKTRFLKDTLIGVYFLTIVDHMFLQTTNFSFSSSLEVRADFDAEDTYPSFI